MRTVRTVSFVEKNGGIKGYVEELPGTVGFGKTIAECEGMFESYRVDACRESMAYGGRIQGLPSGEGRVPDDRAVVISGLKA